MTLLQLEPGTKFRVPGTDRTGTLLYANECRARVKYDGEDRHVELKDGTSFDVLGRAVDISSGREVKAI